MFLVHSIIILKKEIEPIYMPKQKVFIQYKYRGSVYLPSTKKAKDIFSRVKQAYANHETMGLHLLFTDAKIKKLQSYQRGGAQKELELLDLYIQLGDLLSFKTEDAYRLKENILMTNDHAHTHFNINKRLTLINKKKPSHAKKSYLFWDIENFSNIFC